MYSLSDIRALFDTPLKRSGRYYFTLCPFRKENTGSFSIRLDKGTFKCWGCGKFGRLEDLPALLNKSSVLHTYTHSIEEEVDENSDPIKDEVISAFVNVLWNSSTLLSQLKTRIPDERIIREYNLGYCPEKNRFTIPIYVGKDCYNIKLVSFTNRIKQLNWARGKKGRVQLFGRDSLESSNRIIISAGEWDRLVLRCYDFPSITGTAGENTWLAEWNEEFRHKRVFVVYDQDATGRSAAIKVASNLFYYADEVRIVSFDIDMGKGGDTSDYFLKFNKTPQDFIRCLKQAKLVTENDIKETILYDETSITSLFPVVITAQNRGLRVK